jgi:hypothetical protein
MNTDSGAAIPANAYTALDSRLTDQIRRSAR